MTALTDEREKIVVDQGSAKPESTAEICQSSQRTGRV